MVSLQMRRTRSVHMLVFLLLAWTVRLRGTSFKLLFNLYLTTLLLGFEFDQPSHQRGRHPTPSFVPK